MKWDYRIIGITGPETQSGVAEMFARHGAEGWELVTIDFDRGWAYFKRLILPDVAEMLEQFHELERAAAEKTDPMSLASKVVAIYEGKPCDNLSDDAVRIFIEDKLDERGVS